jgi:hypothetical protein
MGVSSFSVIVEERITQGDLMTTRWARFARGWAVAGFSTFVAALSHTLGGGRPPGWLAVVVSLAFAGVLCVGLSGRTLSGVRVSVSVLASQLLFHGLFSLGASGGSLPPRPAADSLLGYHHAGVVALGVSPAPAMPSPHTAHDAGMWVAHAAAAVVTILVLRYGEAAVRALVANLRIVVRPLVDQASVLPRIPRSVPRTAPVVVRRGVAAVLSPMRHRGPPAQVSHAF